jgi:hypothetical protein
MYMFDPELEPDPDPAAGVTDKLEFERSQNFRQTRIQMATSVFRMASRSEWNDI